MKRLGTVLMCIILTAGCGSDSEPRDASNQRPDAGSSDMMSSSADVEGSPDLAKDISTPRDAEQQEITSISVAASEFRTCERECTDNDGTCVTMESPLWGDIVGNAIYDGGTEGPIYACDDVPEESTVGLDGTEEALETVECYCLI